MGNKPLCVLFPIPSEHYRVLARMKRRDAEEAEAGSYRELLEVAGWSAGGRGVLEDPCSSPPRDGV